MSDEAKSSATSNLEPLRERLAQVERELAEARVQLSELEERHQGLEQLYATTPVGLCLIDTDLRFVRINQRLAEINGCSVEAHIGKHLREILPQICETLEPIYRRVIETGEPTRDVEVEAVSRTVPDRIETYLADYLPLCSSTNEVLGVSTVVRDITERKEAEAAKDASEKHLRLLLEHAPEAIVVLDVDTGKFVEWNDNALALFGLTAEALSEANPIDLSPPKQPSGEPSAPVVREKIEQALAGATPVVEWTHLHASGAEVPCEIRLVRLPVAGRRLVRGSITDVSSRRADEQALRQAYDEMEDRVERRTAELARSEERWRSLIAMAPDLIMTADADGIIQYSNRPEAGYDPADVAKTCVYDYVSEEYRPAVIQAVAAVIETGEYLSLEHSITGADGKTEWLQTRIGPYWEDGKIVGATSISTNVTRRKMAEDRIKAEQQLLRQLLALQENERRMVSHDIHDGLVQYIVGAQMQLQAMSPQESESDIEASNLGSIEAHLQQAIAEGRRLIRDLRPMVLDEAGVVESLLHLIADQEEAAALTIAFEHDVQFDRLDAMLEGAIFRIVQESLTNVKKHANTAHVGVQLKQTGDMLEITIRDNGEGFDPKQIDPARFGLRGIHERARLFGGKATINSKPGKGTTIQAKLPVTPQAS